jgi:hypothetical protein
MPTYVCENKTCKFRKPNKVYTKEYKDHEVVKPCPFCGTALTKKSAEVTFDSLAADVAEAIGPQYGSSYQKKVIDFLKTADGQPFQADFVLEMKKPTEFGKFTKNNPPRKNDDDTNCFDNAITNAGYPLPRGCPPGEKFDFETAYILGSINWGRMAFCKGRPKLFTQTFKTFLANVKGGYSYMLGTRQNTDANIGHMIYVYVNEDKTQGWLHDPQKQDLSYKDMVCEAWESPAEAGNEQRPGCTLNLTTGVLGEWED